MSDELTGLIAKLEHEVQPLERALRLREAEEAHRLHIEEARLAAAQARQRAAEATLKSEAAQLVVLDARRAELRRVTDGWRGQLWSIGYGFLTTCALLSVLTAYPIVLRWFGQNTALGVVAAQFLAFGILYVLIPKKR